MRSYRSVLNRSVVAALGAFAGAAVAFGQDSGAEANTSSEVEIETIAVTGSRIRGVAPTGSDVITVGRADITQTTSLSVADILKEVPQVVGVGINEASYTVTTGAGSSNLSRGTAINLRGLGPTATLVLFDGYRLTESGVAATFVDTSVFPTIALERFEIVADGSSAIYGSDAVAGVVNLILRKDFDGAETEARYVFADGYERWQVSQLLGTTWSSGSAILAYEFADNSTLMSTERDWYVQDQRSRGGADYRATQCDPGNLVLDGVSYALPGTNAPTAADLVPNTRNLCDISYAAIIPKQRRHNATLRIEQDLSDSVTLSAAGFYSRRDFRSEFINQGSNLASTATLTVPNTNAFFIAPVGTDPASVVVQHSFYNERGPVTAEGDLKSYGAFATLGVELPADWRAELSGTHTKNEGEVYSRNINTAALNAALASSDPQTALDPFGNRTNPAVLDSIYSGLFVPIGENMLQTFAARFDGPLFDLPGGTVRLATGAEYHRGEVSRGTIRGTVTNPNVTGAFELDRNVKSGYAELHVPIVGSGNAVTGISRLDLSLAGRYDKYSDFGSTTNPKFGLTWEVNDSVSFRGSYGTSFRAPLLTELVVISPRIQVVNAVDPLSPTGRTQGLSIRGNPESLGPEEATSWSFGTTLTPESVPGLSVNLNWFSVDYEGLIFAVEGVDALVQEAIYGDLVIRNPTQAQIDAVLNMGLNLDGVLPPTVGFIVDSRAYNRGITKESGLDFQVSYELPTSFGDLRFATNGMYLTKYDYQVTPLAPTVDRLNTITNPVKLAARAGVDWHRDAWRAGLWVNYVNSYDNNQVEPVQKVDSWTTVDLHFGYELGDGSGNALTDGYSLHLDISNIADEDPPYVNTVTAYDPQQASPFGRMISIGVTKVW